jgi:hypothetical protein
MKNNIKKIEIIEFDSYKTLDEAKKLIPKGRRILFTSELFELMESKSKLIKDMPLANYYFTSLGAVVFGNCGSRFHVDGYFRFDVSSGRSRGVLVVKEDKKDEQTKN